MANKPDMPCASCGKLLWRGGRRSIPGLTRCRDCQRAEIKHGSYAMYNKRRCRCDECKQANAEYMRGYAERYRERTGTDWRSNYPDSPRTWISVTRRLGVYERDAWICHLCSQPVDRAAAPNTDFAPSLDHIVPRVHGGDDSESNLKCAHRLCNSRRGAQALEVA